MERRKAITTAAAASLTLLAGAGGIALNSGVVSARGDDNVGQLSPVDATPLTVYVDDPATAASTSPPPVQASDGQPVATSAASSYQDDDRHEQGDDDHDDEHGDRDEYEGAEDDD